MAAEPRYRALTRPPPATYAHALTRDAVARAVDLNLALEQHAAYVATLRSIGVAVTELPPDPAFPDSCFVQDPGFALERVLVMARPAAPSRRREGQSLLAALEPAGLAVYRMTRPATLDGGDILITEDRLYVGQSSRTNADAMDQLRLVFSRPVVPVPVPDQFLHLLTGCSYLGQGRLLTSPACAALPALAGLRHLVVPEAEALAANALALGEDLIVPAGYPATAALLEAARFRLHPVAISEYEKRDGSVTCLSLFF